MEKVVLNVELREKTGKGVCRRLRNEGKVPAVVYGKGMDPVSVAVNAKELAAAIAGEGGRNNLITLNGDKSLDGKLVIVSDLTKDCLKGNMIHVDLHKITLKEKVKVPVPVSLVGTAKGVKEGGLLDLVMHTVDVECLPTQIPEHIEIDVTELQIGGSFHVGDIIVPAGVKVLADETSTVVSILGKAKEEVVSAEATEE
jgi:large subunit ribosomal protein L25